MSNYRQLRLVEPIVTPAHTGEWAQWMQAAGMSRRTIEARTQVVDLLERRAGLDPVTLDWQPLAAFLGNPAFSAGTRQTYQAHLRSYYQWLVITDQRVDDPTVKLHKTRVPRRKPKPVTVAQLGRLLATRMHERTRWMILLGAYEGLRVHEIAKIRGEHIYGDTLHVLGKGGVDEEVPVHPLIADIAGRAPDRGYWFPSHTKLGPIAGNSVSTILSNAMDRAGIPRTGHSLRHFFGTQTLKTSGGNLRIAQELMRHANIASTVLYTEVDDEERRSAVMRLPVPLRIA